jgi:hypothetical protein
LYAEDKLADPRPAFDELFFLLDGLQGHLGVDTYLGNVEQNDSRKIDPAKAPRRKVKKYVSNFPNFASLRLCGRHSLSICSSFPNFKYLWLVFKP